MRSCAIFDLDGTIIAHSSEKVFLKYLLEQGDIPVSNLLSWIGDFIKTRNLRQSKANKIYLRGLNYQYVCDQARTCFTERLVGQIFPQVVDLMESHRSAGRMIVILSGSLELLVRLFQAELKTDVMIGYALEVVDGHITGRRVGLNPYGENKAALVQRLAKEYDFDLNGSYAYGNHYSDVHHLQLVGHPVTVNPDRKLRQIAIANGWRSEQFHIGE